MAPSQGAEGWSTPASPTHAPAAAVDTAAFAPPPEAEEQDAGLFTIIDESGEGWGFELTPSTVAKPLALLGGFLFAVGAMAGVPAGIALGRSAAAAEDKAAAPPSTPAGPVGGRGAGGVTPLPPTAAAAASAGAKSSAPPSVARAELSGVLFATKAFGLGTLLCCTGGAVAAYATHWFLGVNSIEEFAVVMREAVPRRREALEGALSPVVGGLRGAAGGALPPIFDRARKRFQASAAGQWVRTHLESAVTVVDADGEGAAEVAGAAEAAGVTSGEGPAAVATGLVSGGSRGDPPMRLSPGDGLTAVMGQGGGGVADSATRNSGRCEERAAAPRGGLPLLPPAHSPRIPSSSERHAPHDAAAVAAGVRATEAAAGVTMTPTAPLLPRPDGWLLGVGRPLGEVGPAATAPATSAPFRVATNARRGQALESLLGRGPAVDAPGAGRAVG
ncbi:hypothetical protein MMPV_006004 [Pyropia vietnamensis]